MTDNEDQCMKHRAYRECLLQPVKCFDDYSRFLKF